MRLLDYKEDKILDATKEDYTNASPFEQMLFNQNLVSYCLKRHIDMKPYIERFGIKFISSSK